MHRSQGRSHRAESSEARPPGKSRAGPALLALGLIACLLASVAGVLLLRNSQPPQAAPEQIGPRAGDPFAGVPDETPPPRSNPTGDADPFAGARTGDSVELFGSKSWTEAEEKAALAVDLIREADDALALGDKPKARELGQRAQALLMEALTDSESLALDAEKKYGPADPSVLRMGKKRQTWTRDVQALKKFAEL